MVADYAYILAALKFIDAESSPVVLKLTDKVTEELKTKHPNSAPIRDNSLLFRPIELIPKCVFGSIDEQTVMKAALNIKGSAVWNGLRTLHANAMPKKLQCSRQSSMGGNCISVQKHIDHILSSFTDRSICGIKTELVKNPGIRPIGVGEVLRRIIGQVISHHSNSEIKESAGPLQTYLCQSWHMCGSRNICNEADVRK